MNSKIISLFFIVSFLLSSCGQDKNTAINGDKADSNKETEETLVIDLEEQKEEERKQSIKIEDGEKTPIKSFNISNARQKNGPFEIIIHSIELSQFQPNEDKIVEYGGSDLGLISIELEVENHSDNKNNIYPMQGLVITDTGKEIDVHFSLSDQVGGEFQGEVKKEGKVHCFFVGQSEKISKLTYQIEAGHDQELQFLGNDFQFVFNFG
ncbi:MAG: hypothetical protein L0I79_03430 [Atopostipes sp.]|nr:hypothetical protein [Atopostipes sp.]